MDDLISRQAAIDAVHKEFDDCIVWDESGMTTANEVEKILDSVPSAQPYSLDEWCTDCKEYDHEKHCCPRFNRVIRDALNEVEPMRKRGKWIIEKDATGATYGRCSVCGIKQYGGHMNFCYECGADMRGGEK